jgi:catechol 2,3-dioxygenase-like lactoylglutathione lyase family enzyme
VTQPPDESAVHSFFGLDALKASGIAVSAADHVGVAVRDVDEAIGRYGRLFGVRQWRALAESRAAGLTPTLVGADESGTPAFSYLESPQPTAVLIELVAESLPPSFLTEATTRTL